MLACSEATHLFPGENQTRSVLIEEDKKSCDLKGDDQALRGPLPASITTNTERSKLLLHTADIQHWTNKKTCKTWCRHPLQMNNYFNEHEHDPEMMGWLTTPALCPLTSSFMVEVCEHRMIASRIFSLGTSEHCDTTDCVAGSRGDVIIMNKVLTAVQGS